ncbi:Rz1-like lysis system protein LysC [Kingella sp. SNUBH-2017]|jgi:hypothetical protein|uniref:Rz1-like lysis system protein LysC n=1 Tax=Kingella pumchi TaxID=2779506 RepID=A0ABS9NL26_9NEIS|nr:MULTISPECIES: Rz1-like lysis system protein LysC [Kingella]MCG6503504.1 Rz1-like lysis system protein LysC [Kingella pumchi]MDD2183664.1 Rz1-like lysis system protein LysC [Kingella sp. SNUBH-2017]
MKRYALIAAVLLAACTARQPENRAARSALLLCPNVPECRAPEADIRTNGELADAYLATAAALEQCRIARNTLQHCIDSHNAGSLKGRRP